MMNLPLAGLKDERSKIKVKDTILGGKEIIIIGGPCAVESKEQMRSAAKAVQEAGGKILRGGIYKPRTSPYNFQGLGEEGIAYLADAAEEYGLLSVTEVMDEQGLEAVKERIDIVQIGARNMQNFQLLKKLGTVKKPVILKRGLSATIEEWLYAAEYILAGGNKQVILCERGIRTFETSTRNTLDLSAVSLAKKLSHLPVIVDPSHAAGRIDLIPSLAKAAIAVGADGLLVEMHPNPAEAMCDGAQSLTPAQFRELLKELQVIGHGVNRELYLPLEDTGIEPLRKRINLIDRDIVQLLADRMKLVRRIGKHKNPEHIRDGKREAEILQKLESWATEVNCPAELLQQIYPLIFDCSIRLQLKGKRSREAEYVI
ncbi:MAG: bifunctional 3-deoxy-7-phosphoheptulonate synthase/chorismate mutase [Desulfitobacteriaceae bacterium]|nr:bifunctional 3-deoxy-7-phosphoheptulonate synthase/chorismate mutase [Desulfitobacteriaceae bacterium]MDD4345786.1 bifunctional 3-deoxy-7-phosphoheptulonate synthase/chorismate mutase [Desulfitobacteriaceae bacterium]MDD4401474.1 bifunctional 3-deoxy-7-phosphoheptulonate synthase/chorismate mutase [Desulfitobacteriaceae bacterium]